MVELSGTTFGSWLVLKYAGKTKNNKRLWECRCSCGLVKTVRQEHLNSGASTKCRTCATKQESPKSSLKEYATWQNMRQRCYGSASSRDKTNYHDRGIKVCDRWDSFENFLEDMGRSPEGRYSIDRIDVNGDYSPDNCRWADDKTQANNTRRTNYITYNNETMTISQWSERTGIGYKTFRGRLDKGWSIDDIINTPIRFSSRWHK